MGQVKYFPVILELSPIGVDKTTTTCYNTIMKRNNNTNEKENKMTKKTQEQLRQEGLRAARNMVRKFKAREKIRKSPSKLARS